MAPHVRHPPDPRRPGPGPGPGAVVRPRRHRRPARLGARPGAARRGDHRGRRAGPARRADAARPCPASAAARCAGSPAIWLDALDEARALPDDELPTNPPLDGPPPPHRWAERDPVAAARLARCREVVTGTAAEHTLPPENLISPDSIRRLAWTPPEEVDAGDGGGHPARLRRPGVAGRPDRRRPRRRARRAGKIRPAARLPRRVSATTRSACRPSVARSAYGRNAGRMRPPPSGARGRRHEVLGARRAKTAGLRAQPSRAQRAAVTQLSTVGRSALHSSEWRIPSSVVNSGAQWSSSRARVLRVNEPTESPGRGPVSTTRSGLSATAWKAASELAHRRTVAGPEVDHVVRPLAVGRQHLVEVPQRLHVRLRQVPHVDEVADAGAVAGRPVGAGDARTRRPPPAP